MPVGGKICEEDREQAIAMRAQFIRDPIQRLRYLRTAMRVDPPPPRKRRRSRRSWNGAFLLAAFLLAPLSTVSDMPEVPHRPVVVRTAPEIGPAAGVWLVEKKDTYELYSNGLRIENRWAVANEKRAYPVFRRADLVGAEWRSEPAGIVYHTTESHLVPFDPSQNVRLQRVGASLLAYVRNNRSYHFLIDRFGRVHRIVQESDAANHAGFSVWADERWVYVNLNHSFFGVAFETQTERDETATSVTAAQLHAARILTETLRAAYGIPAANCVTHAQVSVNPRNMRIGHHTDWAGNFPFPQMGLTDNYALPLPSVCLFGFGYDPVFLGSTGVRLWKGLLAAEDLLRRRAAEQGIPVSRYRAALRDSYRQTLAVLRSEPAGQEDKP